MDDMNQKSTLRAARSQRRRDALYETIETAAAKLGMGSTALRARCRRAAIREGRDVVAYLGAGIIAYKIGHSWRVKFPPAV